MFYQIFLSPQVKQCAIVTYKHGIYELSQRLAPPRQNEHFRRWGGLCAHTRKKKNEIPVKVARAANLKLGFTDQSSLQPGSTNEATHNPIPKSRQTSIISKKPGFLPEKLKTLTSSNYHRV